MGFFVLASLFSWLIDLGTLRWQTDREKDLEILLLRRQLAILHRVQARPPRLTRWEKLGLAVLVGTLSRLPTEARKRVLESLRLFTPETVLKWHRELVRRKWTFRRQRAPGRPRISADLEELILRLARENPRWGYRRIAGELQKLGYRVGRSTISAVLRRHRVPPAPTRDRGSSSWRTWFRHYRQQVLATPAPGPDKGHEIASNRSCNTPRAAVSAVERCDRVVEATGGSIRSATTTGLPHKRGRGNCHPYLIGVPLAHL